MNRRQLLASALTEEKNVSTLVATTIKKDNKVLSKAKRDLQDSLDEAEEALEQRLSTDAPLDKSVVEVLFAKVKNLKESIQLYEEFEKEYLNE
jgi:hypothetical protein